MDDRAVAIDWQAIPPWQIQRDDMSFAFRTSTSSLVPEYITTVVDDDVTMLSFGTSGRTWAYVVKAVGNPVILQRPEYIGLFYSPVDDLALRPIKRVMFHDINVRIITFGHPVGNDYLLVLRKR